MESVKADADLQEKLNGAADLDFAVAMAKEAGFDASQMLKPDWELLKAQQTIELSDDELEQVSGVEALQTMPAPVPALPT